MKLGFIVPTAYLESFATASDFHLVLAHLVDKDPVYTAFYKSRSDAGDFVLLDNSIFELEKSYDPNKLLDLAYRVGAREVVVPEVLKDSRGSLFAAEAFLDTLDTGAFRRFRFSATIQGKTYVEFENHYRSIREHFGAHISTINIPFDVDCFSHATMLTQSSTLQRVYNRISLVEELLVSDTLNEDLDHHLMGLADGVELQHYSRRGYGFIRSNDSSSAFVHGINGVRYTDRGLPGEKILQKLDFSMSSPLSAPQIENVNYNIATLKHFATLR